MKRLDIIPWLLCLFLALPAWAAQVDRSTPEAIYSHNLNVSVAGSGNTELINMSLPGTVTVLCHVDNNASGQDLDAFEIKAKGHSLASLATMYSESGDYTSPIGILKGAGIEDDTVGDLTVIETGEVGWFLMETKSVVQMSIEASAASDSATVDVYCGAGK